MNDGRADVDGQQVINKRAITYISLDETPVAYHS
jgi:hypothetical protein